MNNDHIIPQISGREEKEWPDIDDLAFELESNCSMGSTSSIWTSASTVPMENEVAMKLRDLERRLVKSEQKNNDMNEVKRSLFFEKQKTGFLKFEKKKLETENDLLLLEIGDNEMIQGSSSTLSAANNKDSTSTVEAFNKKNGSENILLDGRYHIRCQRQPCFYLLGGFSGLCASLDIDERQARIASVAGELELINRKNGVVLFRHVKTGRYLSLVYNNLEQNYKVLFMSIADIAWKMAEFELIQRNKNVSSPNSNGFFIRSLATGFYVRIEERNQLNNASVPSICSADVNEPTNATSFLFEPRSKFISSIEICFPAGIYHIRLAATQFYLAECGKLMTIADANVRRGLFRVQWNYGDGKNDGTLSISSARTGKYLCRPTNNIPITYDSAHIPKYSHPRVPWDTDHWPLIFLWKNATNNVAARFELCTLDSRTGRVTLRETQHGSACFYVYCSPAINRLLSHRFSDIIKYGCYGCLHFEPATKEQ